MHILVFHKVEFYTHMKEDLYMHRLYSCVWMYVSGGNASGCECECCICLWQRSFSGSSSSSSRNNRSSRVWSGQRGRWVVNVLWSEGKGCWTLGWSRLIDQRDRWKSQRRGRAMERVYTLNQISLTPGKRINRDDQLSLRNGKTRQEESGDRHLSRQRMKER